MSSTWETVRTALADAKTAEELMRDATLRAELAREPGAILRHFRLARPEPAIARSARIVVRRSATKHAALLTR
ncbi:MAG TPA: hypothetical protein VFM06_12435 [Candidatus Limnocylindria bacterium]|nr:hypothetical protein [Candidatus Limnocylindria bacterium]